MTGDRELKLDLIAGLGNPRRKYRDTRHNIGRRVIDLLGRELGIRLKSRRFQSRNGRAEFHGKEIILLYPATFMNLSGRSVKGCAEYYHLQTEDILIIHDDLDLQVGRIKVSRKGSAGGHKGVLSIIEYLGSKEFPRVRIGIGRPRYGETTEDFVLSPFYADEKEIMERVIQVAVRACLLFVSEGIESVMNHINC